MRLSIVAAFALIAAPALAQDYSRPEIIRGLCQKDGCDEFSVLSAERVRADEEGTLLRTRIRTYLASSRGRTETGEETGYVFCSLSKPTILAENEGKFAGFQIATAPTQETREMIRQQSNYYSIYFTICHGAEAGRAAAQNLAGVAQQYGYRSPLAKSVMVTFTNPDEVFSRPVHSAGRKDGERLHAERTAREVRSHDLVPPRGIPSSREGAVQADQFGDRRRNEGVVEGRVIEERGDMVVVEERHSAPEVTPWYREPQRWLESLNPF